jgi:hypothetical protein
MIVYIVEAGMKYEDSEIIGVFVSRHDANKEMASLESKHLYDWVGVTDHKVR